MKNKVAIVTGAQSGIGEATCLYLGEKGCIVVATGRSEEKLSLIKNKMNRYGYICDTFVLDVTNEEEWNQLCKYVFKKYNSIDYLVNNAGVTSREKVHEGTRELWDKIMNTNAYGPYLGMKYCIPYMQRNHYGSIVNVSSVGGLVGIGGGTAYPASKGAIYSMTRRVAINYGQDNIRANIVCPGWIETPMTEGAREAKKEQFMDRQALKYFGKPEDVAHAIIFLLSDLSKFTTGIQLIVDGGFTAE